MVLAPARAAQPVERCAPRDEDRETRRDRAGMMHAVRGSNVYQLALAALASASLTLASCPRASSLATDGGPNAVPVIISARKDVRYESVVHVMDVLQKAGVVRVGLSVRTTGA